MGVIDKFLNAMKMNDDDDFSEDGYLDDAYDDFEEEAPKKRILSRDYEEDEEDDPVPPKESQPTVSASSGNKSASSRKSSSRPVSRTSSKVAPMRARKGAGMEVCVIRPRSMEDAREITETLLDECTVVLNMEGLDLDIAQRIVDFTSGSCYAIHGNLQRISNNIFIITPQSVDISGDFQEILSGAFEVPAFGTRF